MKCLSAAILSSVALICMTMCFLSAKPGIGSVIGGAVSASVMIFSSAAWWAATKHE